MLATLSDKIAQHVLKVCEGAFCLPNLVVRPADDILVPSSHFHGTRRVEHSALGLDALPDIDDLLVDTLVCLVLMVRSCDDKRRRKLTMVDNGGEERQRRGMLYYSRNTPGRCMRRPNNRTGGDSGWAEFTAASGNRRDTLGLRSSL